MRSSSIGEKENLSQPYESAAINALISTLPSLDSQRQYPLRLKPFFDFCCISGTSIGEKWYLSGVERFYSLVVYSLDKFALLCNIFFR